MSDFNIDINSTPLNVDVNVTSSQQTVNIVVEENIIQQNVEVIVEEGDVIPQYVDIDISSTQQDIDIVVSEFRGRSAYQVWLDAGNTGSLDDFFADIGVLSPEASASINDLFERRGSGILSGSVLNYIPVIVSQSSQIQLSGVSGFTTFSSSVDGRITLSENFSSSINTVIKDKMNLDGVVSSSSQIQLDGISGNTFSSQDFTFPQNLTVSQSVYILGDITASAISNINYIDFDTTSNIDVDEGSVGWNTNDGTLNLGLYEGVVLQVGQELHYRVRNQSGNLIPNGSVVYTTGVVDNKLLVDRFIANNTEDHEKVLGVTTSDIENNSNGYVTYFGYVRDIDTSAFLFGDEIFASTTIIGGLTNIEPLPPNQSIFIGYVTNVDVQSGSIFVKTHAHQNADDTLFYNSGSNLISTNVGGALRELDLRKADVSLLSSNITLFPTTATSSIANYYRMVTATTDGDYNATAVDVPTGDISGSSQLIASLVSDENIFVGNPGIITISTIGNIRKVGGSGLAEFYFEIYQRSGSVENLIGTSNSTPPIDTTEYTQFYASALLNNGSFSETDKIVIKYYGVRVPGASNPSYEFQFGGDNPVRTLLPVPVSVIPSDDAIDILTDTSNFTNILSTSDTNVQFALETLDDHTHTLQEISDAGNTTSNQLNLGGLEVDGGVLYVDAVTNSVGINTTSPSASLYVVGNLIVEGGITGSIAATNGIVSSSTQIDIDSVSGFSTYSSSVNLSIISASFIDAGFF